ncbi:MAG TPA: YncE family protein [Nitrososphaerales archaeon]|nr:YncE family protein [Nitrososphaerales archaeon]
MSEAGMIPIPNLNGRIDHMAFDSQRQQLYVAALGNNSLDVVDLASGQLKRALVGFNEPQGVAYVSGSDRVYVSNGGSGVVNILDANSLSTVASISIGPDADNIRYDPNLNLVYIGYGQGAVAAMNSTSQDVVGTIGLAGHPEAFAIDQPSRTMFVNVPGSGYIAVANTSTYSVLERWPLGNATGNFPMALDTANSRLFVGTRSPAELVVIDSGTGKTVTTLSIPQDPDDIYFDVGNGCIYISSGSGFLTAVKENDPSHFSIVQEVATANGARTSLLIPELGLYCVAAPGSQSSQAKILEFKID